MASGENEIFSVLNNLRLTDISNNLCDSKSLAWQFNTTTHSNISPEDRARLGIFDGYIRVSVGLENAHDWIEDLDQVVAFLCASEPSELA